MGCFVDFNELGVDVRSGCGKNAQKYLIEVLLTYSQYDLKALAEVLEVSPLFLCNVLQGKSYLNETNAQKLWE